MIHVVIPAAGRSQRFIDAGYPVKALVDVMGKPMMKRVIENVRPVQQHRVTVVSQIPLPGIDADVVLSGPTGGSVESILRAEITDEPLLLVNQDQLVHTDWQIPDSPSAGAIATFASCKPHHSYVTLDDDGYIAEIAEKQVISSQAVAGIYYFPDGSLFRQAAETVIKEDRRVLGEFYVSTVLAEMIACGVKLRTFPAEVAILGTPEELQLFLAAARVARSL